VAVTKNEMTKGERQVYMRVKVAFAIGFIWGLRSREGAARSGGRRGRLGNVLTQTKFIDINGVG